VKGSVAVLTGLLLACAATPAWAQVPRYPAMSNQPYSQPVVSPYLNLARGGNPAINYFGLVRPQIQAQENYLQLRQDLAQAAQVNQMEGAAIAGAITTLTTGNQVTFGNHYAWYQTVNGRFGSGTGATTTGFNTQPGIGGATLTPYAYGRR
jgi:hypothetical protein